MDGPGSMQEGDRVWTPGCIPCTFEKDGVSQGDDAVDIPVIEWSKLSVSVVDGGKRKSIPFEDATAKHVKKFYPNLGARTYRIPASLLYPKSMQNGKSEKSAKKRSDLDSNEEVVRALDAWGKNGNEPMLILVEYKINSYLHKVEVSGKNPIAKSYGDHDILVLHKKYGVMFLQLKACEQSSTFKNKRDALKKASEQLHRDVKFFLKMNQDLPYSAFLPLKTYVALPNLSKNYLSEIGVCETHKTKILTKVDISTPSDFKKWLESVGFINNDQRCDQLAFSDEQFAEMFGRYAGLASTTQIRPYLKAVKDAAFFVKKVLLTPQQNTLLSAKERNVILLGDFGSGKSLVITQMAETLAKTPDHHTVKVFVVSCASVSRTRMPGFITDAQEYFTRFLSNDVISRDAQNIEIMSVKEFISCVLQEEGGTAVPRQPSDDTAKMLQLNPEFILKLLKSLYEHYGPNKVHVFFDELPYISNWNWRKLDSLIDVCPEMYVWIVLASGTYNLQPGYDHVMHMRALLPRFHVERLKQSVRMTQKCYQLYQAMKEYVGIDDSKLTDYGNFVSGLDPLWYPLNGCRCPQENVSSFKPIDCKCLSDRLFRVFREIWEYRLRDIYLDNICIILGDKHVKCITNFLASHVANALTKLKIPHDPYGGLESNDFSHPFDGEHRVSIVDHVSIKGCEKFIVIVICPYESPLIWHSDGGRFGSDFPVCRALSNVILVTLSSSERKYFEDKAIEETATCHWDHVGGKSFSERQSQLCESARQYMAGKKIDFYDYLVEKQVLLKCAIHKNE